ncbi:hypothetical protein D3C78_1501350 [compost metagenome]
MLQVDPGFLVEDHARVMGARSRAVRGHAELAGVGLGILDEFLQRAHWNCGVRHEEQRILHQICHLP